MPVTDGLLGLPRAPLLRNTPLITLFGWRTCIATLAAAMGGGTVIEPSTFLPPSTGETPLDRFVNVSRRVSPGELGDTGRGYPRVGSGGVSS